MRAIALSLVGALVLVFASGYVIYGKLDLDETAEHGISFVNTFCRLNEVANMQNELEEKVARGIDPHEIEIACGEELEFSLSGTIRFPGDENKDDDEGDEEEE